MNRHRLTGRIYGILDRFSLSRRAVRLLSAKYELLYGRDEYSISIRVCRDLGIILVLVIVIPVLAGISSPDLFGIISACFFVYVAVTEVFSRQLYRTKRTFYKELAEFIGQVRHHYYRTMSVGTAIWEAHGSVSRSMQLHGNYLYEALFAEDTETAHQAYMEVCPDKYLRLFAALVFKVDEEGDHEGTKGSDFLNNLKRLKLDVAEELRYEERKKHKFTGFSLTAALPLLSVPFIGNWGTKTVDGMAAFYTGTGGVLVRAAGLCLTIACYSAVISLREGEWTHSSMHELSEKLASNRRIRGLLNRILDHNIRKTDHIRELIGRTGENISVWAFKINQLGNAAVFALLSSTVAFRAGGGAIAMLLCFFAGLFPGYELPVMRLELRKEIQRGKRQEEIIRLQSVIGISLHTAGTTVLSLLQTMEEFAEVFRPAIRTCLYEYVIDDQSALTKMKYSDNYLPFRYICDCLLMADEVGLISAFSEITEDMESQRENDRLELSILLEDRMYLAMLLAIIPGMFLLFGYLLIPFLSNAMDMFNSYTGQLENMLKEGLY